MMESTTKQKICLPCVLHAEDRYPLGKLKTFSFIECARLPCARAFVECVCHTNRRAFSSVAFLTANRFIFLFFSRRRFRRLAFVSSSSEHRDRLCREFCGFEYRTRHHSHVDACVVAKFSMVAKSFFFFFSEHRAFGGTDFTHPTVAWFPRDVLLRAK